MVMRQSMMFTSRVLLVVAQDGRARVKQVLLLIAFIILETLLPAHALQDMCCKALLKMAIAVVILITVVDKEKE